MQPPCPIGSIWTVTGFPHALVVVIVGPFRAAPDLREYVVAPLYTGRETGWRQTNEDVRLDPAETGRDGPCFVGLWNAGPALEQDLIQQVGLVETAALEELRDLYWATLNEEPLGGRRIGKAIRSRRDSAAAFQEAELERWRLLAARVFQAVEDRRSSLSQPPLFAAVQYDETVFTGADLSVLLQADPRTILDEVGQVGPIFVQSAGSYHRVGAYVSTVAFDRTLNAALLQEIRESVVVDVAQQGAVPAVAANADYALAA